MNISDELKNCVKFIGNSTINEDVYKKLLENTFAALTLKTEINNLSSLYNSKPDLIKEVYAVMLKITSEFARNNLSKDEARLFLIDSNFSSSKAGMFADLYDRNKGDLQIALGNIGSHLPHIIDVEWKIDYIVKASNLDQSEGPVFRVALLTSKWDEDSKKRKTDRVYFTCNSQELQDLVYKLKDAVRHCQRLITE